MGKRSLDAGFWVLFLDVRFCSQLADVAALGAGIGKLPSLTALTLDFGSHAQHSLLRGQFFQLKQVIGSFCAVFFFGKATT